VTTTVLFPQIKNNSKAKIISKHPYPIVICGLPIVKAVLKKIDENCEIQSDFADGNLLQPGETLLIATGPASALLMAERVVLNFLQRLCAIATLTAQFVKAISHTSTKILDTRKTTPGFRHLEKYAVHCGGGVNHRMGLYDAIMVKDTHIDLLGGMAVALKVLPETITQHFPVIVEVRTIDELMIVLEQGQHKVTRVLLDNMTPALMAECVSMCKGKITTEASGNMTLENVTAAAESGVDYISVGKITHSAGSVDLSMKGEF
jgi:nicotinate-nucleotide pyrophosphorylase (carboxylating)